MKDLKEQKGLLGWFASNHVAANLLMLLIITSGLLTIFTVKIELFPEMSLDIISIEVPYRGASPEDVEEGVCIRVEEAIAAIDGIKRIRSTAAEAVGIITVEVEEYADTQKVLDDIKAEVDRITTFPEETEKPIITENTTRYEVITIVLHGNISEKTLKELAEEIRDDLTSLENISQVDIKGVRNYEISIEASEKTLRRHNLTFDQVAAIIGQSSLDIPAGSIETPGGEVLVRTEGQKYYGPQFEEIIVLTKNDGTNVRLSDIATVIDGFEDSEISSRFDGQPSAMVKVFRVGDQGALDVANTVKEYVENKRNTLPNGVSIALWQDWSEILLSRINLLKKNAYIGLTLVFLCLIIFLDLRLALWTTMGILISFFGAFWLMPAFDISLNMISLYAFIMTLGIVVDDAIVVGENIYTYKQQGMGGLSAAIKGVKEMASPVILAILTTIFAFLPLLYVSGIMGKIMRVIPLVVIAVLSISLVEALFILPAHLSSTRHFVKSKFLSTLDKYRLWVDKMLQRFLNGPFKKFLTFAVKFRYATLACGIAILFSTIGFIKGGYIKFTFFDAVEADNMVAFLTMPQGTPVNKTLKITSEIEQAVNQINSEYKKQNPKKPPIIRHVSTTIGTHPAKEEGGPVRRNLGPAASHLGEVNAELLQSEERGDVSSNKLKERWRKLIGEIPGVSSLTFLAEIAVAGDPINVEISHENFDLLLEVVEELKLILDEYAGVEDIADSFEPGKPELELALKDSGRNLGLTLADLARQVRQGFYGEEVQRIQRGRHDIRVMVRYPQDQRRSIADVENMRVRLPDGTEIPFNAVAKVNYGRGYATISRADRRRIVSVSADVDESAANADEINRDLEQNIFPKLTQKYMGLKCKFAGEQREQSESMNSLYLNFPIALLAIYGLLAVQFRSYIQPVIVMSAIPFGIVGATIGHIMMGYNLSFLSMFGIVALSGVVVNDSLILIDLINRQRKNPSDNLEITVRNSAIKRFRPIMLTTLTTFFGLFPIMLEQSLQARFLIPMAISLAFGVVFATIITLFLVPSLYLILEDIKQFIAKILGQSEEQKTNNN